MVKPITPREVAKLKENILPDFVLEAFNHCIAKNFDGSFASFKQSEVAKEIRKRQKEADPNDKRDIFEHRWLDVEPIYQKVGWDVVYDSPAFNETGPAVFKFFQKTKCCG